MSRKAFVRLSAGDSGTGDGSVGSPLIDRRMRPKYHGSLVWDGGPVEEPPEDDKVVDIEDDRCCFFTSAIISGILPMSRLSSRKSIQGWTRVRESN